MANTGSNFTSISKWTLRRGSVHEATRRIRGEGERTSSLQVKSESQWFKAIFQMLEFYIRRSSEEYGIIQFTKDPCIYTSSVGESSIIGIYVVDDFVIAAGEKSTVTEVLHERSRRATLYPWSSDHSSS